MVLTDWGFTIGDAVGTSNYLPSLKENSKCTQVNLKLWGDQKLFGSMWNAPLVLWGTSTYKAQYPSLFARLQLQESLHLLTRWSESAVLCVTFAHLLCPQNRDHLSNIVFKHTFVFMSVAYLQYKKMAVKCIALILLTDNWTLQDIYLC